MAIHLIARSIFPDDIGQVAVAVFVFNTWSPIDAILRASPYTVVGIANSVAMQKIFSYKIFILVKRPFERGVVLRVDNGWKGNSAYTIVLIYGGTGRIKFQGGARFF